jgi:hypothetical protein
VLRLRLRRELHRDVLAVEHGWPEAATAGFLLRYHPHREAEKRLDLE